MDQPLQITLKDIPQSAAVEQELRKEAGKLEQFFDHITSCHIVVEQTARQHLQGKLHNVRIHLHIPNHEIICNQNFDENLYLAIRQAFDDARRQLEEQSQQMRHKTQPPAETLHGEIVRLFNDKQFGFINATDGDEYYFNASNLAHSPTFEQLQIGDPVQFTPAIGDDGAQAHHVRIKRKGNSSA